MKVTDVTPGRRSPTARLRSQTRRITPGGGPVPRLRKLALAAVPASGPARRARSLAGAVLPATGPTARMRSRSRAIRSAAKRSRLRQADWQALGSFALSVAAPPPRRRPNPKLVVGATGALGAGAAAAAVARRKSESAERTDREAGGPTSADRPTDTEPVTGAGQATKGNLHFESHR